MKQGKTSSSSGTVWPEDMLRYKAIIDSKPNLAGFSEEEKYRMARRILGSTYADITDNWAFKWVFGNNPDLLIMLLRDILAEDISSIEYLPTDSLAGTDGDKQAAMDVCCRTSDGRQFVVEMQTTKKTDFRSRLIYYGAAAIHRQVKTGDPAYDYDDVRVIAIMNYGTRHAEGSPKDKVLYQYVLRETETGELYGRQLSVYMLELEKLQRNLEKVTDGVQEWCYIFRNISTFVGIPESINPRFHKLMDAIRINKMSENDKANYLGSSLSDYERADIAKANYDYGREEGFDAGMEQGRAVGRAEGAQSERIEIARNLLTIGLDVATVSKVTGLSEEEIKALSKSN